MTVDFRELTAADDRVAVIATAPLTGNSAAKFDPVKLGWIGTPTTETNTCLARGESPVRSYRDLFERELIVGDAGPGNGIQLKDGSLVFPAQYTIGNAGRNILTGPGTVSSDISLQRNFRLPLRDAGRLEFRAEAFNAFNSVKFFPPDMNTTGANYGRLTSADRPRVMQLALRFTF